MCCSKSVDLTNDILMSMMLFGQLNSSNELVNFDIIVQNDFVDVFPSFLLCFEPMNVELILSPMFMNLYSCCINDCGLILLSSYPLICFKCH